MRKLFTIILLGFLASCSGPESSGSDAGPLDMSTSVDLGGMDTGRSDVGSEDTGDGPPDLGRLDAGRLDVGAEDSGAGDLGAPAGRLGTISGDCGVLDDELVSMQPDYFASAIDFAMDPYDDADLERLSAGGQEIVADGNAGGSSLLSEVFAFEVLQRCEGAVLLKTETEVLYTDPSGKLTDLLVEIDGVKIGVSVTRAVGFPREDPYTEQQATDLLTDKLLDVQASSTNVAEADRWEKQILHVLAYAPEHGESLRTAYAALGSDVKSDTVVWVTVTDGDDMFLY